MATEAQMRANRKWKKKNRDKVNAQMKRYRELYPNRALIYRFNNAFNRMLKEPELKELLKAKIGELKHEKDT